MTEPVAPYRCPVTGCTTTSPDLVTHMATSHDNNSLMTALLRVTSQPTRTDSEEPQR